MQTDKLISLVYALDDLCDLMNRHFRCNNGGCCYIAYIISKTLEELNVEYSVKLFSSDVDNDEYTPEEIEDAIKLREHRFGSGDDVVSHYAISANIDDDSYDINIGGFSCHSSWDVNLNSSDLKWIYDTGNWNMAYDRFYNITAKKLVNTIVNAYKLKYEEKD